MNLVEIKPEDLIFTNKCFEDRINTELRLRDNSWMDYQLTTAFNTKNQGKLDVVFEYYGTVDSQMEVEQKLIGKTVKIIYEYPSDIFEKHITKFMTKHLAAWKDTYAFNGEDLVINFFNEVIENGHVWDREEIVMSREELLKEMQECIEETIYEVKGEILAEYAEQNCIDAIYELGELHFEMGDFGRAEECFEEAALKGHAKAKYKLGILYETGEPFEMTEDFEKAWSLYKEAADEDNCAEAQYEIGCHYYYDYYANKVTRDYKKAFEYFTKAALKKYPDAIRMLAECYYYGRGINKDYEKAFELLREAYREVQC